MADLIWPTVAGIGAAVALSRVTPLDLIFEKEADEEDAHEEPEHQAVGELAARHERDEDGEFIQERYTGVDTSGHI